METIEVYIEFVTIYFIVPVILIMSIIERFYNESNHKKAYSKSENIHFYWIEGLFRTIVDFPHLWREVAYSAYFSKHL